MKDFFFYKTELPLDSGFAMFGVCHLLWIIGIGIFSWWMGRFFSFAKKQNVIRMKYVLGVLLPVMELYRCIVLLMIGHFVPDEYPLHLCNMALWLATIYLWTKNRFVGAVYVLLCLPAAALAVVFPGWLSYPFWNFMHIHSFLYHGLVVAIGWGIIRSGELIPTWKELWKPLLFGIAGYVVMSEINLRLDTNFWFLNLPSYESPLALIYKWTGKDGYLMGHFMFCASVVVVWRALLEVFTRCMKKRKKNEKLESKPI